MAWRLPSLFLLRRVSRSLSGIEAQLAIQNRLLARLADQIAPQDPQTDLAEVARDTGADHLDPLEAALALQFAGRVRASLGREPDDEEILAHLADEKTKDLHQRLTEREADLARLARERGR